jgi:hypothetical protein
MHRSLPLSILALSVIGVSTAQAQPSITLARSCYIFGETMGGQTAGFAPNSTLKIAGGKDWLGTQSIRTDRTGGTNLGLQAPAAPARGSRFAVKRVTLKISDPRHRSRRARKSLSFSNVIADPGKQANPRARRTWRFIGIRGTGPLYGHFVFDGKLVHSHSFGTPKGPCGRLSARAPGIAVPKSKLRAGTWSVQFDRNRQFVANGPDSLTQQMALPQRYSTGK